MMLLQTGGRATVRVQVHDRCEGERIVLRSDANWDRDVAPIAVAPTSRGNRMGSSLGGVSTWRGRGPESSATPVVCRAPLDIAMTCAPASGASHDENAWAMRVHIPFQHFFAR